MTERPVEQDEADQQRADWEGMAAPFYEPPEDEELMEIMKEDFYNGSTPG